MGKNGGRPIIYKKFDTNLSNRVVSLLASSNTYIQDTIDDNGIRSATDWLSGLTATTTFPSGNTGPATYNGKPLVKANNQALVSGDLVPFTEYQITFDPTLDRYFIIDSINVAPTVLDYKVKATTNDTTANFLTSKLVAGSNITLTLQNPGANENILIDAGSSGWAKTGNVLIAGDFLGSTNNIPLVFKVNSNQIGKIDPSNGNVGFGGQVGVGGVDNVAMGNTTLQSISSGSENAAIGRGALSSNSSGSNNTAIGSLAGSQITTGSNNIFVGANAGANSGNLSNRLFIDNTNTLTPLINGNFSINSLSLGRIAAPTQVSTIAVPTLALKTVRDYANDAAADADTTLESGGAYTITGSRALYRKP